MTSVWTRMTKTPLWGRARLVLERARGSRSRSSHAVSLVVTLMAVMGVALSAASTPRPDQDRMAEAIALTTRGDLGPVGLAALLANMDPAQRALALRYDPRFRSMASADLMPGWESIALGGQPPVLSDAESEAARKLNAALPIASGALRPARAFVFNPASSGDRERARRCLTQVVYYEAALEADDGQAGVAQVVLNRVRDPNYPTSICGVVYQGAERITGCQFSFTCDGSLARAPAAWAWDRARKVADRALSGHVATQVGTATHYHADYVRAWWAPTLAKITQIGTHIFYRWKGIYGETAAFRQAYSGREPVIDEARFARPRLQIASADATDPDGVGEGKDAEVGELKTVQIDGQTRVVGIVSLGGRRQPTSEDIAAINERLRAFEAPKPAPSAPPVAPPAGVTPMDVEEVGRPAN